MEQLQPYQYADIGIMGGTAHMLATIVRILEENELVERGEFASVLEESVSGLAGEPSPFPPDVQRLDSALMVRVATILRTGKKKGWKPIVIQGGLADE